jgi:hypothetical protein
MNFKGTLLISNKRKKVMKKMKSFQRKTIVLNSRLLNTNLNKTLIWKWTLIILMQFRKMETKLKALKSQKIRKITLYHKTSLLQKTKLNLILKTKWKPKTSKKNKQCKYTLEQSSMLSECFRMDVQVSRKYLSNFTEFQKTPNPKLKNSNLLTTLISPIKMDSVISYVI